MVLVCRNMSPELLCSKDYYKRGVLVAIEFLPLTVTVVILALQQCLHQ